MLTQAVNGHPSRLRIIGAFEIHRDRVGCRE
jgi:hypothetical protein